MQGGEFEVLKSIDWEHIRFDVLCIETEPGNRPKGYADKITNFLVGKGYTNYSGQKGRNICESIAPYLVSSSIYN